LLTGPRFLSVRQATLAIAGALTGTDTDFDPGLAGGAAAALDPGTALVILVVIIVTSCLLASWALGRFQVRSAD
jgi:hypothetical protein